MLVINTCHAAHHLGGSWMWGSIKAISLLTWRVVRESPRSQLVWRALPGARCERLSRCPLGRSACTTCALREAAFRDSLLHAFLWDHPYHLNPSFFRTRSHMMCSSKRQSDTLSREGSHMAQFTGRRPIATSTQRKRLPLERQGTSSTRS